MLWARGVVPGWAHIEGVFTVCKEYKDGFIIGASKRDINYKLFHLTY
jgi:hypothetical protein